MFARVYPDQAPSYLEHPDLFEELWEQAILAQKDHKVVWNVGFRGQGDRPFWSDDRRFNTPEERGKLISRIMRRQCELIREYVANPVSALIYMEKYWSCTAPAILTFPMM